VVLPFRIGLPQMNFLYILWVLSRHDLGSEAIIIGYVGVASITLLANLTHPAN